jgi:hypothetical protein
MLGHEWRSVHRNDLQEWFNAGWAFVVADGEKPQHYIVEWLARTKPIEPSKNRVPETPNHENANGDARRQQPA